MFDIRGWQSYTLLLLTINNNYIGHSAQKEVQYKCADQEKGINNKIMETPEFKQKQTKTAKNSKFLF